MWHPCDLQHPFFHVAIIASLAQELFSTLIATETEEKDLWRFQRDQPESQAFTSTHHVLATVTSQHRGPGWKSQKREEPGCLEQVVMAPHVWQPQGSCSNAGGHFGRRQWLCISLQCHRTLQRKPLFQASSAPSVPWRGVDPSRPSCGRDQRVSRKTTESSSLWF